MIYLTCQIRHFRILDKLVRVSSYRTLVNMPFHAMCLKRGLILFRKMLYVVVFLISILILSWIRNKFKTKRIPVGPKAGRLLEMRFKWILTFISILKLGVNNMGQYFIAISKTNMIVLSSPELIRKAFASDKYGPIFNDRPESLIPCRGLQWNTANPKWQWRIFCLHLLSTTLSCTLHYN